MLLVDPSHPPRFVSSAYPDVQVPNRTPGGKPPRNAGSPRNPHRASGIRKIERGSDRHLSSLSKDVTPVHIYGWDLPADTAPLRQAAAKLIAGEFDVALLTTSTQLVNLMKIAEEEGIERQVREALQSAFVGSIGPLPRRPWKAMVSSRISSPPSENGTARERSRRPRSQGTRR